MRRFAVMAGIFAVAGILAFGNTSTSAHHSYAMFDRNKTATVSGTVRTLQWTNPHVYLWVVVANDKGNRDVWGFEFGGGPNGLVRNGWSKDTIKPGDKVTVKYHPLKDGRTGGEFESLTLTDGQVWDARGKVPAGGRPQRDGSD